MAKILIVEDSNLMVSVITNFVRKEDETHEIVTAHNGEEAVKKYQEENPDLVFMDIKMPGMDGLTALEEIKKLDSNAKIVMVTALKEKTQEDKAMGLGALAYITKPFSREDIAGALKKAIQ